MRLTFAVCNVGCKFAEFKGWYPAENSCLFNTNTVAARIPTSLQLFTDKHTVFSIIFTRLKNAVQKYTHKSLRIRPCITYCCGKSYARSIDFSISSVYVLFIYTVVNRLDKFPAVRSLRSGLKDPRGSEKKCLGQSTEMQNAPKRFRNVFPKRPPNLRCHRLKPFSRMRTRV